MPSDLDLLDQFEDAVFLWVRKRVIFADQDLFLTWRIKIAAVLRVNLMFFQKVLTKNVWNFGGKGLGIPSMRNYEIV